MAAKAVLESRRTNASEPLFCTVRLKVPLRGRGMVGVLEVGSRHKRALFSENEM